MRLLWLGNGYGKCRYTYRFDFLSPECDELARRYLNTKGAQKGAYIVQDAEGTPDVILLASGSVKFLTLVYSWCKNCLMPKVFLHVLCLYLQKVCSVIRLRNIRKVLFLQELKYLVLLQVCRVNLQGLVGANGKSVWFGIIRIFCTIQSA